MEDQLQSKRPRQQVHAKRIGVVANGGTTIEKAYLGIGISEVYLHLPSDELRAQQDELRPCIRHRLFKIWLMRAICAGIGAFYLIILALLGFVPVATDILEYFIWHMSVAALLGWVAYRIFFGAAVDEHFGIVRIEQSQLHQIGSILDARGEGTGRRSLMQDMLDKAHF